MNDIANRLGIRRIGWIFTDLVPDDGQIGGGGPVLHHRGNVVGLKSR